MDAIAAQFGDEFKDLQKRQNSYDFLRNFIATSHDWKKAASPDSDLLVPALQAKLRPMTAKQFAFLLCHSGYIPEEYSHDSSEETIYTKMIETLVQEWARRMGFERSELPKQKSSKEDITVRDANNVIVCDAKSYRLGRSQKAPNVKDALKEGDIAKWLSAYQIEKLNALGGLVTFPSQHDWSSGSDFYQYLTNKSLPIVCFFYEHMAFMLLHNISKDDVIKLFQSYEKLYPVQLKKTDRNRSVYWLRTEEFLFAGREKQWKEFMPPAQSIVKEMVYHTIRNVEKHLDDVRHSHTADIPPDATIEELKEMLIEARIKLASFAVGRQLTCIRGFRDHSESYMST